MTMVGRLTRARYEDLKRRVQTEPVNELTRARLLARARQLAPIEGVRPARQRRWGGAMAASVVGCAAGALAVLMLSPATRQQDFGHVTGSEELSVPLKGLGLDLAKAPREFRVQTEDPAQTAAAFAQSLALGGASFSVSSAADGKVVVAINPLSIVSPPIVNAAHRLGIAITPEVSLRIEFQRP